MRNLKGFMYFCALVIMSGTASAQIKIVIDNQVIPTSDIESIVILPNSNLISVSTNIPYTVTASGANPVPAPEGTVSITSFSASATSITRGQSTTLSWATQNASSCTSSGGTGGWNTISVGLPSGSAAVTIASAGTYTFTLNCQDSSGASAVKSVTVLAKAPVTTTSCSAAPLSGNVKDWKSFWLVDFPAPGYDNRFATIPRTGYLALKFKTGNLVDDGKMSTIETTITDGVRLGSFSECPGDFDVAPECDYVWGISGGIRWATNGRTGACQLKPNTTYYFNVTFTDGVSGSTSTCNTSTCVTNLQAVNRQSFQFIVKPGT